MTHSSDPAAICSALNAALKKKRWTAKKEPLCLESHAKFGKSVVQFQAGDLGVTVHWWPDINSIRVWAVTPVFLPGIDKINWDESTHAHRLSESYDIHAALRVINDYALPNTAKTTPTH